MSVERQSRGVLNARRVLVLFGVLTAFSSVADPARRVLNIVNFVRALDPRLPKAEYVRALDEEVKLNRKYGFPNTVLLQYDALVDAEMLATARKSDPAKTEFGLWFEMSEPLNEAADLAWKPSKGHEGWKWDWLINPGCLMAYDHDGRRRLIDAAFAKFKEIFGQYPKSAGSWLLDAWSMNYMVEKYGVDGFCICREQDNTDAYGLRGGYSNGAYYPSKRNMLSAAVDMRNAVRAPVFKMLTPDPIHNYGRISQLYADYPYERGVPTLEPGSRMGSDPRIVDWLFRVYTEPKGLLNLSYMQTGQENSFGWDLISKGWPMQCAKIAAEEAAGRIVVETMGDTARRFKLDHPANCPQTQIALEDWNAGRRKSVWYNSRFYRANLILDGDRLVFRDIHKMSDDFEEPFLNKKCLGWQALYYTPPVVDQWLFRDDAASGTMAFDGTFASLMVEPAENDALVVTATRTSGERVTVRLDEKGVTVVGARLEAEYSDAFRKTMTVCGDALAFVFSGHRYQMPVKGELVATERGFRLSGERVELDLSVTTCGGEMKTQDAMSTPALNDVRLRGWPGRKLTNLIRERCTCEHARTEIFTEARRAFQDRDDDGGRCRGLGGMWRGEFWGKQMLSCARVADYLDDAEYRDWIAQECHRMIELQDDDGYLGSYSDKTLVVPKDGIVKAFGWKSCWNLWSRKYAIWAMLMAYKATGDHAILESVERQMDQWIDMLGKLNLQVNETGSKHGMASMSVLKPLLMLYETDGRRKYLDYAAKIVSSFSNGRMPNLVGNAFNGKPLHEWYADPCYWAKSYEMMSCLDGLLEYYRVTGARTCLDAVLSIRDNLAASEANPFGAVGFGDQFIGATNYVNGLNEVCDVIHWIRLNLDLFLITGEDRFMDAVETAYLNAYLGGIYRKGDWGPFFIRSHGRHQYQNQIGCAYSQCCVNNLPRTFMDVASGVVTKDAKGAYHVNLFQDATVKLDGVSFAISGNYPVGSRVTVKVGDGDAKVVFRRPGWCPRMDVLRMDADRGAEYTLIFDMNPRLAERKFADLSKNRKDKGEWAYERYRDYWSEQVNLDVQQEYRTTPAAQVLWGPLVLCKSWRTGLTRAQAMDDSTIYGKGYAVKVTPRNGAEESSVWGLWDVVLEKAGAPTVRTTACDFQSGSDMPASEGGGFFSIWF